MRKTTPGDPSTGQGVPGGLSWGAAPTTHCPVVPTNHYSEVPTTHYALPNSTHYPLPTCPPLAEKVNISQLTYIHIHRPFPLSIEKV